MAAVDAGPASAMLAVVRFLAVSLVVVALAISAGCSSGSSSEAPAVEPSSLFDFDLVPAFGDLALDEPTDIEPLSGMPGQYLVTEKKGTIRLVDSEQETAEQVADLRDRVSSTGREEGLLSLALSPDFLSSGEFLVYYSADRPRRAVLSRLRLENGSVDPAAEEVLMEKPHERDRHWGGGMEFDSDGYLFLSIGDGSPHGDDFGNGQDLTDLEGSILRLAITGTGYSVPPDNPFVGNDQGFREEVWAYGLRNPWRLALDSQTGRLWVADAGHANWEEVNVVGRGANMGWNIREDFDCFRSETCESEDLTDPLLAYSHDEGCAVIGGYVYRGRLLPEVAGDYIFGDYCSGSIWSVSQANPEKRLLLDSDEQIYAFGRDEDGEILVLTAAGTIYRLVGRSEDQRVA